MTTRQDDRHAEPTAPWRAGILWRLVSFLPFLTFLAINLPGTDYFPAMFATPPDIMGMPLALAQAVAGLQPDEVSPGWVPSS